MYSLDFNPQAAIGLAVTLALGFGVGSLVRSAGASLGELTPPNEQVREQWRDLVTLETGGRWIGHVERPLFFAAAWLNGWVLLSAWLVMKTALYWQGSTFAAYPSEPPNVDQTAYLAAKRRLHSHYVTTLLVGTAANLLAAFIGLAVGQWLRFE
jgi:hypothetical protein